LENGYDLPKAVATISLLPARAANLSDRGEIRLGLRADLVHVAQAGSQFVVRQVWREGKRVF
jgi:alpha-D-ribose 1-methylphosphonate 5-triphosphate diphosphatase